MKLSQISLPAVLLVLFQVASADVPSAQLAEVEHLISYLENSPCMLIRNGKAYSGPEGAKHVRRKYEYFRKKLNSTEQFIELSASRSSMSDQDYTVECPGEPVMTSNEWLHSELARFRQVTEG